MYDTGLAQLFAYHARMLRDRARVEAYRAALSATLRAGDVVVDLGTGTGILALLACQAGARKVYAIERGRIAKLARQLVQANGCADRIEIIDGESTSVTLAERADVLVTETLWNFGLGEGLLSSVADAKERLLAPGARIIPRRLELYAAPVELPDAFKRFEVWNDGTLGLNLAAARSTVLAVLYPADAGNEALLAPGACLSSIDLGAPLNLQGAVGGDAGFSIARDGTLHGLLGWFRAELAPGIQVTNAPPNPCPSWHQALLPVDPPLAVQSGDVLAARVDAVGDATVFRWHVELSRNGAVLARREASTLKAFARLKPC